MTVTDIYIYIYRGYIMSLLFLMFIFGSPQNFFGELCVAVV